jgi:hypothetical protein
MASAAVAKRGKSARAAQAAAKQRRQMILVIGLVVVLAALLAWEVPHVLKRSGASSPTAASTVPVPTASAPQHKAQPLRGGGTGADPFAGKPGPSQDAHAVAGGGSDPFSALAGVHHASSPAAPVESASRPIPKRIVIGRPGGHRVARHGWIVILASIPTRSGRESAVRFARSAHGRVGRLSVLNSSNRRPLRGGYWVVYAGPYSTLGAVSRHAGAVHTAGYRTAYIRELITYR